MMEILIQICLLVVGFALLVKGSDWFVDGAAGIATKMGIPQLVVGLTIVAMGTSAPELAVSISSALKGNASICIGNVVGSNILNVLIILGICSIITNIRVAESTIKIEIPFMIFISFGMLVLGWSGQKIVLLEGILLLFFFVSYLIYLYIMAKKNPTKEDENSKNTQWW